MNDCHLPKAYLNRMRDLCGGEFEALLRLYEQEPLRGLRLNPLKCGWNTLQKSLPFRLAAAPFSPLSYYLPGGAGQMGRHPLHHAGAFYVQEPSAACAVTILEPRPGERVLDLCAAPGGKSTQIAALLAGEGLLWSNEVVKNRTGALISNMERAGVRNAVISSCMPDLLCDRLAGFFDRILVDAPCSGEGMFRKDPQAAVDWSLGHVQACAGRQLAILKSASLALRQGGTLVYSTCTFSQEENEGVISAFLREVPGFVLEDCGVLFGRPGRLPQTRRILPMDGGEGHFAAKLRRTAENPCSPAPFLYTTAGRAPAELESLFSGAPFGPVAEIGGKLYALPAGLPRMEGLGVIRAGVYLGDRRGARVEPAHALFMAARPSELNHVLNLPLDSPRLAAFLRGEELEAPELAKGYAGVSVEGVMTGFGKCSNGRLKNRYPKGLRNLS